MRSVKPILLAEDDKLDQKAFMRMVVDDEISYDCTIAGFVSEAQSILASDTFDIVVSDYNLGDGTGFEILNAVKDAPFILVTGTGDEEVATKAWKAGAYDYLIKDHERNYLKAVPITIENTIKHKKTVEKLQLLSGAIMSADDSIYITDAQDEIIFVNKAFLETYGYEEKDVLGKASSILWKEKTETDDTGKIFRTLRGVWEIGFYHKRKDGSEFLVSHSRSSIRDENGNYTGVVGVSRDISEHILVEDKAEILIKN